MFALPISMPRFKSINFCYICLKLSYFGKKVQSFWSTKQFFIDKRISGYAPDLGGENKAIRVIGEEIFKIPVKKFCWKHCGI